MKKTTVNLMFLIFFLGVINAEDIDIKFIKNVKNKDGSIFQYNEAIVPENHSYEGARYPSGVFKLNNYFIIGNVNELLFINENAELLKRIKLPNGVSVGAILFANEYFILLTSYTYDDNAICTIDLKGNKISQIKNCFPLKVSINTSIVNLKLKRFDGTIENYCMEINKGLLFTGGYDVNNTLLFDSNESNTFFELNSSTLIRIKYNNIQLVEQQDGNSGAVLNQKEIPLANYDKDKYDLSIYHYLIKDQRILYLFVGKKSSIKINEKGDYYFIKIVIN